MAKMPLLERIKQGLFILDGAMGTQLFERGDAGGKCNDYLNITSDHIIQEIHEAYIKAGSDAILTNTFGANKFSLSRHGFGDWAERINAAGARIARKAAGHEKYVLGDIGPTGDFLEPLGNLKRCQLENIFKQQAKSLADGGVDGFIIETMAAIDEMIVAVESVKAVSGLPVLASFAYDASDTDFRTMMGVGVEAAVRKTVPLGVTAIGFNCGSASMAGYAELAGRYKKTISDAKHDVLIIAEPNAGLPELIEGQAKYKLTPAEFGRESRRIYQAGAGIIGGCCGTSPAHIAAVVKELRS
jgi:5-methyltetrahydrofolate--homocysteine methyltransferase